MLILVVTLFVLFCFFLLKAFTPEAMKFFFEVHYMDLIANIPVMMYMDALSKSRPELIEPFIHIPLLNPEHFMENMANYHMNIITRVAAVSEVGSVWLLLAR